MPWRSPVGQTALSTARVGEIRPYWRPQWRKYEADGRPADAAARAAFEGAVERQLMSDVPYGVVWRQKEQFSDGVGYSWIDSLKAYAEREVDDADLTRAQWRFPYNTPRTKESYLYRVLFASHFPSEAAARCVPGGDSVACSTPAAIAWDPAFALLADPSGRAVRDVHRQGLAAAAPLTITS